MKTGILTKNNSVQTIDSLKYLKKSGKAIDFVIIETAVRKKYSKNEKIFNQNHFKFKNYLLKKDLKYFIRLAIRKTINKLNNYASVSEYCTQNNINHMQVKKHSSDETINFVIENDINILILLSSAWLIKENLINIDGLKIINLHPGYLPKHRGLDSLFYSVLEKDPIGLSAHLIDTGVDTGDIIKFYDISPINNENILEYRNRVISMKIKFFLKIINSIKTGKVKFKKQEEEEGIHHVPLELKNLIKANNIFKKYYYKNKFYR